MKVLVDKFGRVADFPPEFAEFSLSDGSHVEEVEDFEPDGDPWDYIWEDGELVWSPREEEAQPEPDQERIEELESRIRELESKLEELGLTD